MAIFCGIVPKVGRLSIRARLDAWWSFLITLPISKAASVDISIKFKKF